MVPSKKLTGPITHLHLAGVKLLLHFWNICCTKGGPIFWPAILWQTNSNTSISKFQSKNWYMLVV